MTPLGELVRERIRTSGPISFAGFMETSLYHPEFGYYARAAQKSGRAGDFFTSVDVGPIFGELLARQFSEMWRLLPSSSSSLIPHPSSLPFDLVEAGAGNGRLSRDVLDALQRNDPACYAAVRLSLVEQSPTARDAQPAVLGPHAALLRHSASSLPAHVRGVIFANELLDALPTHAVAMETEGLREVFIDFRDGRFVEVLQAPSTPRIAAYLARAGATLAPGWRAEVNLAAEDWTAAAARSLDGGFLVLIDYGHEEAELYAASHSAGTLTMFRQHTTDPALQEPGTCDITAHVDLSAVCRSANREGLALLARLDQTYFMLGLGLDDMMSSPQGFDSASLRRRLALKTLMLPGGLGSTHKVLVFGRGVGTPRLRCLAYRERIT
jgi:SAM-dependent MidA family methyltransferase